MPFFGGVEGGGTNTTVVILDDNGKELGWAYGESCNPWQLGVEEATRRIATVVEEAKTKAGISLDVSLDGLGLCIGGAQDVMVEIFHEKYPQVAKNIIIRNDTIGSLATTCESEGIVLIAGTGSNCVSMEPGGSLIRCGGWGHFIGDEGGACWIAHRAIKYLYDDDDNFNHSPAKTDVVRQLMHEYFKAEDKDQMLNHFYTNFNKAMFAGFCRVLAESAVKGDPLCKIVFVEAGQVLAKHILAILPSVSKESAEREDGLRIICVGSVWKSWELIKTGFVFTLRAEAGDRIRGIQLLRPTTSSALGAALLVAKNCNIKVTIDVSKNSEVFHQEKI